MGESRRKSILAGEIGFQTKRLAISQSGQLIALGREVPEKRRYAKMRTKLAVLAITVVLLAMMVSSGNCAGILGVAGTGIGVDAPMISQQPSRSYSTGGPQVQADYDGSHWQWDSAEGTYLGTFVSGIGLATRIYPNVHTDGLEVLAIGAAEGELEGNLKWDKDKEGWFFTTPGVVNLDRDGVGKFFLSLPLDESVGTAEHCLRFYALVRDANKKVTTWHPLVIIPWPEVNFVGKKPAANLATTLRFKTEAWPEGCEKPSPDYLIQLMRRAGNGGNGDVYKSLIANDQARAQFKVEQDSQPQTTEKSVTRGTYYLRFVSNGRDYNGRIWIKKPETGVVYGPFRGPTITQNNTVLSVNGNLQSYAVEYSLDGTNFCSSSPKTPGSAGVTVPVEVQR